MGNGYLDRVVFEGDARVFDKGGCGKGCLRIVPKGLGCFESGGRECISSIKEFEHLLN
jgi:hypothetical protein